MICGKLTMSPFENGILEPSMRYRFPLLGPALKPFAPRDTDTTLLTGPPPSKQVVPKLSNGVDRANDVVEVHGTSYVACAGVARASAVPIERARVANTARAARDADLSRARMIFRSVVAVGVRADPLSYGIG